MYANWNPWHGCVKYSEGCLNCYVHRSDARYNRDPKNIYKTKNFTLPIQRRKDHTYKIPSGTLVWTCFSSDFFLNVADDWRREAWKMIKERSDLHFFFITKRIERFYVGLLDDWGDGLDHVTICVTCENQKRADERLAIFKTLPIKHKQIVCAPLLEEINLSAFLDESIEIVTVTGESGITARICDYNWVLSLKEQCVKANVSFCFRQTGMYLLKNNKVYTIPKKYQFLQARKANINYISKKPNRKN